MTQWDLDSRDEDENTQGMSTTVLETVKEYFDRMPPRPILDFLMQYFVDDLNW